MGVARNLLGDQFWIGGAQTSSYRVGTKVKKQLNERSARAAKPISSRKLGEDQNKKGLYGMRPSHKPDLERKLKTTNRFGDKFFIACLAIDGGGGLPGFPPGYAYTSIGAKQSY